MHKNTIYTIGYQGFSLTSFINSLKQNNITCIIDVRSKPYSKYYKDFNKENLQKNLKYNNILYRNYSKEFGAWQSNEEFFSVLDDNTKYLDFNKFQKSEQFKEGYNKIIKGINMGYTFAFLCSEIDPINCHRNIMVAKVFHDNGFNILNLSTQDNLNLTTQKELEKRLLLKYKNLIDHINNDENKLIAAYIEANKSIGYKMKL